MDAMEADDVDWVKEHQTDTPDYSDFESAIRYNAPNIYRHYLSQVEKPDQIRNPRGGDSLLHTAIHYPELLKLLLERGCNPNQVTTPSEHHEETGRTPLVQLASNYERCRSIGEERCMQSAKLLVDAGTDVNLRDRYGASALAFARGQDWKALEQLLTSKGAIPTKDFFERRDKPLFAAIAEGDLAKAKAAIDAGASLHKDHPLHAAIRANRFEIASLLVERGAFPNLTAGKASALDVTDEMTAPGADVERMRELITSKGGRRMRASLEASEAEAQEAEARRQARAAHDAQVGEWLKARLEAENAALAENKSAAYGSEDAKAAEIAKRNSMIDAFHRGTGETVYQRYDNQGNLQWYRKED
jgi:ankyrin repeat protein